MIYYFILGKNPALSVAELDVFMQESHIQYEPVFLTNEAVALDIQEEFSPQEALKTLGGIIKIGVIDKEVSILLLSDVLQSVLHKGIDRSKKVFFGFSIYSEANPKKVEKALSGICKDAKKQLKEQGIKSRWVSSNDPQLSSVIVHKEKLLKNGADICYFFVEKKIYMGRTMAVQPFEEFAFRDYKRPKTDAKSGMLPPKLARMMINLSGKSKETLLDPFCGSGTLAAEAYVLGYKHIYCSDVSEKAVLDSKANLEWLEAHEDKPDIRVTIIQDPVEELYEDIPAKSIQSIVTEPYLGPALGKSFHQKPEAIILELEKLYVSAFETYAKICQDNAMIVMVWPVIRHKDKEYALDIFSQVKSLGFRVDNDYSLLRLYDFQGKGREGVPLYQREGQRVIREIWRFRFNG